MNEQRTAAAPNADSDRPTIDNPQSTACAELGRSIRTPHYAGLDWLAERSATTPGRLALIAEDEALSYGELNERTSALAGRLAAAGVAAGDRIAALLPPGLTYATLIHAAARLQATLVPLNTRLTADELSRQLGRVRPRLLLYDDPHGAVAAAAANQGIRVRTWHELPSASPCRLPPQRFDMESAQAIIFTSGTTGEPKGAMLSFANHFWSAMASAYRLGHDPADRWLSCLPLYHVGGLAVLFRACLYGTTVVLHSRFEPAAFHHAIDTQAITGTSLVPVMLQRLLASRQTPWPTSLRLVLLGGAAASPELIAAAQEQNLPVATTYGMTEACSQVATALTQTVMVKPGTVGKALLFTSVGIVDETGASLPPGEIGEITVRGPTVMQGYLDDTRATQRALRDGALHTGDAGYLDADGDLWVVQRRSDIIISGGENIYPAEVEAALDAHPAVDRSCVVGVDDAEWGQRPAALIACRPGRTAREAELVDFIASRLASYKRPRAIFFTDELPHTASGKIERRSVAAEVQKRLSMVDDQ